jgi:transcription elongation GreA/GreB family factor
MSPLGSVLVGSEPGDRVTWHRPVGDLDVTIVELDA